MAAELPGVRKSAVLLLSLDRGQAAEVMKRLPPEAVAEVRREIASLGEITVNTRRDVFGEYYDLALGNTYGGAGGLGPKKASRRKSRSRGAANHAAKQVTPHTRTAPFSFLQGAGSEDLLTFLGDEHPQTIALILAHLPSQQASELLVGLPGPKQVEVVKRIANMEAASPEVVEEVERGLEHRLREFVSQTFGKAGGADTVAEVLNPVARPTGPGIIEGFGAEAPDLAEQVRRLMFVFEDILLVDDTGMASVLEEVDDEELSLALKTASRDLKDKIFRSMSGRAARMIAEDMQDMGPVRVSDVEAAQQKIVDAVRRLEEAGEIVIAGRGGA